MQNQQTRKIRRLLFHLTLNPFHSIKTRICNLRGLITKKKCVAFQKSVNHQVYQIIDSILIPLYTV